MYIRNDVNRIVRELLPTYINPPVDIQVIAEKIEYKVYTATFKKEYINGGVKFIDNELDNLGIIYIRQTDSCRFQNFVIAHELGHIIMRKELHSHGILEKVNPWQIDNGFNHLCIEANEFANLLLMPTKEIIRQYGIYHSTEVLAQVFQVPLSIMSYRLFNLGLKCDW